MGSSLAGSHRLRAVGWTALALALLAAAAVLLATFLLWPLWLAHGARANRSREGFSDGVSHASTWHPGQPRPYHDAFAFGVELLPAGTTHRRGELSDAERRIAAVRPYVAAIDGSTGDTGFKYPIEVDDAVFKSMLRWAAAQGGGPELDASKPGSTYEVIMPARVPADARLALIEHYRERLNAAAAALGVSPPDFNLTLLHVGRAETEVRISNDASSIFDRFRLKGTLCWHRSGKAVGHCAHFDAVVDTETDTVRTLQLQYIGVLPEEEAADRYVAPGGSLAGHKPTFS